MKLDPQASRVTSVFMVLALLVMAALAWSVSREAHDAAEPHDNRSAPPAANVTPGGQPPAE